MALDKGAVQTSGLDKGAVQSAADSGTNIDGVLFSDEDTFFNGNVIGPDQDVAGDDEEDPDLIFHGLITNGIAATLFEDEDILYHGDISIFSIEGSLFEDPDIFFGGLVENVIIIPKVFVKLYLDDNIVGIGGSFVDLAAEITLEEQGASAEGTVHLGVDVESNSV